MAIDIDRSSNSHHFRVVRSPHRANSSSSPQPRRKIAIASPRRIPPDRLPNGQAPPPVDPNLPLRNWLAAQLQARPSKFRFFLVWLALVFGGLGLCANLFKLQVWQAPELQEVAQQQHRRLPPFVPRRSIVDRDNHLLATDRLSYILYAHPFLFKLSYEDVASQLAPILGLSPTDLLDTLHSAPSGIRLTENLSESETREVADLKIDGLELIQRPTRSYPREDWVAEVLGYVNLEGEAQAGVELSQQDLLIRADRQPDSVESGLLDRYAPSFARLDDLKLQLTVDSRLQRLVRPILDNQVYNFGAKRGTVMVMDASNGEILCLVTSPSYNPNKYFDADLETLKNWAVTDLYEPGSTFKPINVAIALEAGAISPNSSFYDPGQIIVDGWPINNAGGGGHGQIDVTDIVRFSSNVGMVRIVEQMERGDFYDWLVKIGLGDKSYIDLPFETPSQLKVREQFVGSAVEAATAAFGQGFALTPVQMLRLQGALANGGKLMTPHVVRGLYDSQNRQHWKPDLPPPKQVFSPETTKTVLEMMETVVESGTATNAYIPGYRVAGKTGTAQKITAGGGYSDYAIVTSFVGIFPAEAPRYVVLAVVDEPMGGSGGAVAAPIVKSVIELLAGIEGVPPSE
ncbi:MAG TPA: penicillin-binding protein 2 [Oscillatoriales cyanobacterium M59_W2019_021]|nr:MAG: penicillin-binding protein 2 [Cyanobacteria bacterium J055]HIK30675.1 penicillin-binding protein 2 [Oscillatoriales cyanobacterium M4454_W2019_049]HIK52547.1 penicillin-binding protein 2 [Oscillatoriales cyanobacterium M59_W2019_021]